MAEQMATKRKTKKTKVLDDEIPSLPDLNDIDIIQNDLIIDIQYNNENCNIKERELIVDEVVEDCERLDIINSGDVVINSEIMVDTEKSINANYKDKYQHKTIKENIKVLDIEKLYPSLSESLINMNMHTLIDINVTSEESKNSIDTVTARITKPIAPMEEWRLPEPLSIQEMKLYYHNTMIDNMDLLEEHLLQEIQQEEDNCVGGNHPLVALIIAYQRSIVQLQSMEDKLSIVRKDNCNKEQYLWTITNKTGIKEAKCRDNIVQKQSYNYDEAIYNNEVSKQIEGCLSSVINELIDKQTLIKYECGLNKCLINDYLLCVRSQQDITPSLRQCLSILFRFLRQLPINKQLTTNLIEWITYLGSLISCKGIANDKLYLLWQLLHAPAGVGEWGVSLIQLDNDNETIVSTLYMLLASNKHRDQLLHLWNPDITNINGNICHNDDDNNWAMVDSDGENDETISSSWSLLRESDLINFLAQVPLSKLFQTVLNMDNNNSSNEQQYDPTRSCHPSTLFTMMGFCQQMISIFHRGFHNYHNSRYKTLNKRISRLIKHTVQFLTDHLEAVLGVSVLPQYDAFFQNETRLRLLSQYETIYESALVSILKNRRHGNWQCLADFPWRMLSPNRKWLFLTRLIDLNQNEIPTDNEWFLNNLHILVDTISQDDAIYLLTAISNLAIESRDFIEREMILLSTITWLIFQICYVIPSTRNAFSKVGRELLSSLCLQHPQSLSIILESMKLWHPTVGQMGLFLFRELPFCLMIPSDVEFRLLSSWLLDNAPSTTCNQLARYLFSNLNWGFGNTDETILYLPLSLHQRMAMLLVTSYKKHTMDVKPGPWFMNESIRLVTYLWWNQEAIQDQSFHTWCLSVSSRLRLHVSTRLKISDTICLQQSSAINTSEWLQALSDAQQDRCSNPVAMYMAVTTSRDNTNTIDSNLLKIIQNLVLRHQQYRLSLELIHQIITISTSVQMSIFLSYDLFMNIWKQVIHADDTYYNMVKNLISKQFPGPVLSCIGNSFCPSIIIADGDKDRQETTMKFFLRSMTCQPNWFTDHSLLWILDKLFEINMALDLKTGSEEMYTVVKQFTDKQFSDASKRSGFAQMFRIGNAFSPLLSQVASGDYMWLKGYILEAQAQVEDEMGLWGEVLYRLFIRKKREPRTVNSAIASACKHLHTSVSLNSSSLVIIQSVQTLAACPPDHLSIIKITAVFFQRYLGFARLWNNKLDGVGSAGHRIFQDDGCHPFLQQARASLSAAKIHHSTQLDVLKQTNSPNVLLLDQLEMLIEKLDMLLLWIDEPRLHLEDMAVSGLPPQYRADLLNLVRLANLNVNTLCFPRRMVLERIRTCAYNWDKRHDLDYRFIRIANSIIFKPKVPISTKLVQRFNRQTSISAICQPRSINYNNIVIPSQALSSPTQILEFISGPLSIIYQSAAKQKANKNFLADLDKKYLIALSKYYEARTINQTVQIPCHRGIQSCAGQALVNLNYQTWVKKSDTIADALRNRQDYNQLVDEIVKFANLDQLIKGVICMQHLIIELDLKMKSARNEEEFKKLVDCGLVLFFHLGRQINVETQNYPPHHSFVYSTMESLGSKFMKYAANQASTLLKGMIDNELLVEVYGPHFCPNTDTSQTSAMYVEVIQAYETGKCSQEVICSILSKFSMTQFLESNPNIASKISMIDALLMAISYTKLNKDLQMMIDNKIEEMHINNLEMILSVSFSTCLPRLLDGFRSLCDQDKLGTRFWIVIMHCINTNIHNNNELVLTIEEIRTELESMGVWLNKQRFSDALCKKHGLYIKHGCNAAAIMAIYGKLLQSLMFKLSRSANENISSWQEVVEKIWDYFLKVYIPWIQSFSVGDGHAQSEINLPWRVEDQFSAENVFCSAMECLNSLLQFITNKDAQSFFLHCIFIWIANGLFLPKQLPIKPFHDTYCSHIKMIKWQNLAPSTECIKLISELLCRPWMSEQCKILCIDVTSQLHWLQSSDNNIIFDVDLITHMFDLFVAMICKTKCVFKVESMDHLADTFIELDWNQLQTSTYKRGMDQLVANLEPRIILCNPSTIEGKVIKLLNNAAGYLVVYDDDEVKIEAIINKQTIYVSTVVRLLSVAFSFTQTKNSKNKSSGDDNQTKLFQLRISGLFSEIEALTVKIKNVDISHRMAISILSEVTQLFKNPSIAILAIDPVIEWLQESRSSPLILPFLITLFRCGPHMTSIVRLAEELIEAYIVSDKSDGSSASWATINSCIRLDAELQQQYWKECVKQSCMLCLVQQILVALPSVLASSNTEKWQSRIVDWLEQSRPQGDFAEHSIILLSFLYLQLLITGCRTSNKPGSAFKNYIQHLLKISESKTSSGFLGKVGLGKRSNFSFEFRMMCRSLSVFLHVQLPTNNILRTRPNDPGAVTSAEMTVSSRTMGEALPTNKTLQNLEWLKSQRVSKELSVNTKAVLESNITFICNPQHSIMDSIVLMRQMCQKLWPDNCNKLLNMIYN